MSVLGKLKVTLLLINMKPDRDYLINLKEKTMLVPNTNMLLNKREIKVRATASITALEVLSELSCGVWYDIYDVILSDGWVQ